MQRHQIDTDLINNSYLKDIHCEIRSISPKVKSLQNEVALIKESITLLSEHLDKILKGK